jgi:hypothetical protein
MCQLFSCWLLQLVSDCPCSLILCHSATNGMSKSISPSKNGCTWWGFKYCMIGRANCPCHIVKKDIKVIGGNWLGHINFSCAWHLSEDLVHCSNIAFAWGFLTMVGVRFIPCDSQRYSKCCSNSLQLSYIKWQHHGYLTTQPGYIYKFCYAIWALIKDLVGC